MNLLGKVFRFVLSNANNRLLYIKLLFIIIALISCLFILNHKLLLSSRLSSKALQHFVNNVFDGNTTQLSATNTFKRIHSLRLFKKKTLIKSKDKTFIKYL